VSILEQVRPRFTFRDFLGYLLAYWFWIMGAAVALLALIMIRQMINVMWPALGEAILKWHETWTEMPDGLVQIGDRTNWTIRAIDRFALVFLGLVWLVYSIFTEQFLRMAITDVRLRRLKARVEPPPQPAPGTKESHHATSQEDRAGHPGASRCVRGRDSGPGPGRGLWA
jgi:hypothetical protein